jgi:hypothetical protein
MSLTEPAGYGWHVSFLCAWNIFYSQRAWRPAICRFSCPHSLRTGAAAAHVEVDLLNTFPEEPNGPIVKTAIPGPIAKKAIADLDKCVGEHLLLSHDYN